MEKRTYESGIFRLEKKKGGRGHMSTGPETDAMEREMWLFMVFCVKDNRNFLLKPKEYLPSPVSKMVTQKKGKKSAHWGEEGGGGE